MTSRISFSKLVKDEWKKLNWLMAMQLIGFGLLIPFRILIMMKNAVDYNERWNQEWSLVQAFCGNIGLGLEENTFFILAAGIICALCTFNYLFSSEKLDFLHSLPIKRERLFAVKVLGSFLTFLTAYLAAQAAGLLIGVLYGVCSWRIVLETAAASGMGVLQFLCSYAAALIGIMLTGKLLTAVLAIFSLGFYGPMILLLFDGFRQVFLLTALDSQWDIIEWMHLTSPWLFSFFIGHTTDQPIMTGLTGVMPTLGELCQLVALALALFLIAVQLYRVRKTEAAGSALAFHRTEGIIKILITIPIVQMTAVVGYEMFYSTAWTIGFIILFSVLSCMFMELIYRWDIRLAWKKKHHILITILVSAAIYLIFRYDVMGYNSYLPDKSEIQSMAVKDTMHQFGYDELKDEKGYEVYRVTNVLLDYLETDQIDPIYEIAKNGIENLGKGEFDFDSWDFHIYVSYHLKNGKKIYRQYKVDREVYYSCMDELMKDEEFKQKYFPILSWENYSGYNMVEMTLPKEYLRQQPEKTQNPVQVQTDIQEEKTENLNHVQTDTIDTYEEYITLEIPMDRVREVIEAYKRDLLQASYTEYMEGNANLYFRYATRHYRVDQYSVHETFEETCKILAEIWEEAQETK